MDYAFCKPYTGSVKYSNELFARDPKIVYLLSKTMQKFMFYYKLDGAGPVDNRPSLD